MAVKYRTSEEFVSGLTHALGGTAGRQRSFAATFSADQPRQRALQDRANHRPVEDQLALLDQLTANARAIGVDVVPLASTDALVHAIVDLVGDTPPPATVVAWDHPLLAGIGLVEALATIDAQLVLPEGSKGSTDGTHQEKWRRSAARAALGVTSADYCICETATLVMRNRPGQPRSASLLPEVHAAFITMGQIIACPGELFALMSGPEMVVSGSVTNCMTWVSGNSKTGDIEARLVPGVHGPKRVVIYVLNVPSAHGTAPPRKG